MDRKMADYLPDFLRETREFTQIMNAGQVQAEKAESSIHEVIENAFIETADKTSVKRYEKIMGITPQTEEVEDRRFRLLLSMRAPMGYTMNSLRKYLEDFLGEHGYRIELFHKSYTIQIKVALGVKNNFEDAKQFIKQNIPANMILDMDLLYNQHSTLRNYTHRQLGQLVHRQIKEEVIGDGNTDNKL